MEKFLSFYEIIVSWRTVRLRLLPLLLLGVLLGLSKVQAAQQFQGLCSVIKIEIRQQLALERIGFLATLEITNNEIDAVITDFSALLTFERNISDQNNNIVVEDASDRFFVKPPVVTGTDTIDGKGLIQPGETVRIEWFIIPKINAGGESQSGVQYQVGAQLSGSLYGDEITPEVLEVIPDTITVKPEPQLEITYFQPRDVDGDNPFTPDVVETPVPFTLGVLVKNIGYGQANNITIDSEQPKIVENEQGLLVVPKLLGARISDEPLSGTPSLKLDLGDIPPANCRKGAWDMITTLSGEFIEFNARYTHADELGGEATSIIKSLNAYFMVREAFNDQPGRDNLWDFLATTDKDQTDLIPDTLFESDCNTVPVNHVEAEVLSYAGTQAAVLGRATVEDWIFMRVDDPAQAKLPIASVLRSDGKLLHPRNYWTNTRYDPQTNDELNYLNIFDFVGGALGDYTYQVSYTGVAGDVVPPVTTLQFSGSYEQEGDTTYVQPDTQLFFVVQDASPVGTYYRTDGEAEFAPAYPFSLSVPGTYTLEYYSEDSSGNVEATASATIVVAGDYPSVTDYQSDVDEVLLAGDALSVRPTDIGFSVVVNGDSATLGARAEVYQGVYAWPTLQGIPSSPTRNTDASLIVAGNHVEFYQARVNGGSWSAEAPVAQPLNLSGLGYGQAVIQVRARHSQGSYFVDDSGTLTVTWVIDADAPPTTITGTPATPTNTVDASLMAAGAELYRYTLDAGYYRAEAPVSEGFSFERLPEGDHQVSVIGRIGGEWQDEEAATTVNWRIDRSYGYALDASRLIYTEELGAVSGLVQFGWDGRRQGGIPAAPGWYTVKLTVTDGLGRQTQVTRLVQVGDLLPDGQLLADAGTARQSEVHGRGRWVVWQDQRSGSWNIYALDVLDDSAVPVALTAASLNQERPRTDGDYVVWQAKQADGSWDILAQKLDSADAAVVVTATAGMDEIRPVVAWPWVVYQRRSLDDADAPWQLYAKHMLTGDERAVDATGQDQVDAALHGQWLVWQDYRDVGPGEIYFQELATGETRRITEHPGGQYHPAIEYPWIVWADNRAQQVDLYGYNLYQGAVVQLTDTPEDENRPRLNEQWVVYQEDSAGELARNLRLLHLANRATVQLTNAPSAKDKASLVSGKVVWSETQSDQRTQVRIGSLPDLQPVFHNRNMVAVTEGLLAYQPTAFDLLALWHEQANVVAITRYSQLLPSVVSETVMWNGSAPEGDDFALSEGDFLWVKFAGASILDFGGSECAPQDLAVGINVLVSACVPDDYHAYRLLDELGADQVNGVRMLDAQTGRWQVATVSSGGAILGEDFRIPPIAVVLIDAKQAVSDWLPGRAPEGE